MPMNWTPGVNAKFVLGILEQLKEQNVKLSYQKLAEYIGPECNRKAIDNQMTKLRKQGASGAGAGEQSATATAGESPSTPAATSKKRRAGTTAKKATPSRKAKQAKQSKKSEDGDEELDGMVLGESAEEQKVKTEDGDDSDMGEMSSDQNKQEAI